MVQTIMRRDAACCVSTGWITAKKSFFYLFYGLLRHARNDVTTYITTSLRGVKRRSNPENNRVTTVFTLTFTAPNLHILGIAAPLAPHLTSISSPLKF